MGHPMGEGGVVGPSGGGSSWLHVDRFGPFCSNDAAQLNDEDHPRWPNASPSPIGWERAGVRVFERIGRHATSSTGNRLGMMWSCISGQLHQLPTITRQASSLSCRTWIGVGRKRWMTSAFVVMCSDGLVVRNEPPLASAMGISSWSARCSSTGTFASSHALAASTAPRATSSAGMAPFAKTREDFGDMLGFKRQHRQRGAAGCADGKPIVARRYGPRPKLEGLRTQGRSSRFCATHGLCGLNRGEMLFQQAGLLAFRPDPFHPERLAGDQRQRQ